MADRIREEYVAKLNAARQELETAGIFHRRDLTKYIRRMEREFPIKNKWEPCIRHWENVTEVLTVGPCIWLLPMIMHSVTLEEKRIRTVKYIMVWWKPDFYNSRVQSRPRERIKNNGKIKGKWKINGRKKWLGRLFSIFYFFLTFLINWLSVEYILGILFQ